MDIISRSAAGLPSPSVLSRRTTPWAGITWHHTGGNPTTWRAIHDWQTDGRPEADELIYIGYSYGIGLDGRVTELRGWDYRAAGDHDNSRLQVVFMGNWASRLPPQAALNAAREFAAWAQTKAGRPMPGTAHRDVWPSGHRYDTDCPGNALYAWVRANLATPAAGEDDDMLTKDDLHTLVTSAVFPLDAPKQSLGSTWLATFNDVRKLIAESEADKARDAAMLAAIQALSAGGGSVDSAAVIAAVNAVRDQVLSALAAEVSDLRTDNEQLRARLAAALAPTEG